MAPFTDLITSAKLAYRVQAGSRCDIYRHHLSLGSAQRRNEVVTGSALLTSVAVNEQPSFPDQAMLAWRIPACPESPPFELLPRLKLGCTTRIRVGNILRGQSLL